MPYEATIIAWSSIDGIGRVRLTDGEILRFGGSACGRFVPNVGLAVRVLGIAPHPLGGRRATALELVDPGDADRVLDDKFPLAGTNPSPADVQEFISLTDDVGLLGVILREPLRSRAALRDWFARAGATVDFQQPRAPVVRVGAGNYRVYVCMAELGGGRGIVTFAPDTPFSIRREREMALARAALVPTERIATLEAYGPLESLVLACARGESAIVAHQSAGYLLPVDDWSARARVRPAALPLDAWTRASRSPGGDAVRVGMAALHLPDLFIRGSNANADAWLAEAAAALIMLGRMPQIGDRLGRVTVVSASDEWIGLTV